MTARTQWRAGRRRRQRRAKQESQLRKLRAYLFRVIESVPMSAIADYLSYDSRHPHPLADMILDDDGA